MAGLPRFEPIDRDIQLIIDENLSPEAQRKMLIDFAKEQVAEASRVNASAFGRPIPYETVVDGRRGALVDSAQATSTIVFEFEMLDDVVRWIADALAENSPVLTGRYRQSHVLFADNVEVQPHEPIPPAREYAIISLVPYARKIERGLSDQAKDGVYEVTAMQARRQFGNIAGIKFSYRSAIGGPSMLEDWARKTKMFRKGRRMRPEAHADWLRRQPAVIITVL